MTVGETESSEGGIVHHRVQIPQQLHRNREFDDGLQIAAVEQNETRNHVELAARRGVARAVQTTAQARIVGGVGASAGRSLVVEEREPVEVVHLDEAEGGVQRGVHQLH